MPDLSFAQDPRARHGPAPRLTGLLSSNHRARAADHAVGEQLGLPFGDRLQEPRCPGAETASVNANLQTLLCGWRREPEHWAVSTAKQDLDRQIEALLEAGIARERIYVDKSPARRSTGRGLRAVLGMRAEGRDRGASLDRLGRTVRDTLNMIHAAVRTRDRGAQPRRPNPRRLKAARRIRWPELAVVLLALFAQMERTYTLERTAHARAVAAAKAAASAVRCSWTPTSSPTPRICAIRATRSRRSSRRRGSTHQPHRHLPPGRHRR